MNHDIKLVEDRMNITKDTDELVALTKLRDILVAWKQAKYLDEHVQLQQSVKGA